jgi:hypothetical protein
MAAELKPRVRIPFTTSAIEVIVRFLVVMKQLVEMDQPIISEILLRLVALYASMAGPSNCFNAWTYSVRAWRPVSVMR